MIHASGRQYARIILSVRPTRRANSDFHFLDASSGESRVLGNEIARPTVSRISVAITFRERARVTPRVITIVAFMFY